MGEETGVHGEPGREQNVELTRGEKVLIYGVIGMMWSLVAGISQGSFSIDVVPIWVLGLAIIGVVVFLY